MSETLTSDKFIETLVTLWAIWYARRRVIHEKEHQSPLSTHLFITRYMEEIASLSPMQQPRSIRQRVVPRWIPPTPGYMKLNVDAAVAKSTNKGSVGVVCRNEQGKFICASSVVFEGMTDPETLEALACCEAIALSEDLGLETVQISSDCRRPGARVGDKSGGTLHGSTRHQRQKQSISILHFQL